MADECKDYRVRMSVSFECHIIQRGEDSPEYARHLAEARVRQLFASMLVEDVEITSVVEEVEA